MNELKRLYMLQICDSLFPIGAFTLSNGLETYVQRGVVDSPETLAAYLADYLALAPVSGAGRGRARHAVRIRAGKLAAARSAVHRLSSADGGAAGKCQAVYAAH